MKDDEKEEKKKFWNNILIVVVILGIIVGYYLTYKIRGWIKGKKHLIEKRWSK